MSKRVKGTKTKLAYGDGADIASSTNFTDLAKVTDIKPPKPKSDDIDIINMDSPGADTGKPWKEFTAGWADAGTVELTLQFDKTQAATVYGLFREDKGWKVTFSDGSTWKFDGYINEYGDEVEREEIVTTTVTVKVSGQPAFTAASGS